MIALHSALNGVLHVWFDLECRRKHVAVPSLLQLKEEGGPITGLWRNLISHAKGLSNQGQLPAKEWHGSVIDILLKTQIANICIYTRTWIDMYSWCQPGFCWFFALAFLLLWALLCSNFQLNGHCTAFFMGKGPCYYYCTTTTTEKGLCYYDNYSTIYVLTSLGLSPRVAASATAIPTTNTTALVTTAP